MEFNQLRSFAIVARQGSFTRAAERLALTQPALSLQIKALEREIGTPLFERRNRRIYLTEAGRILLERAEQMLTLEQQAQQDIAGLRGLQTGHLRIGTNDTNCLYVLPPVIHAFRKRYPGVEIHLTNRMSSEVVLLLNEGAIDFGIVTLPVADAHIEVQSLFHREDVVILSSDHALVGQRDISPGDLVQYPLLLLEKGSTSRELLDRVLAQSEVEPKVMELGSVEVIKRYVEIGLGISVVPAIAVTEQVQSGRIQTVRLPWLPKRVVGLVQRQDGRLPAAGERFIDLLKEHIQANLRPLQSET